MTAAPTTTADLRECDTGTMNVLFLGKSDRRIEAWAKHHARLIRGEPGRVIFLAPYGHNYTEDNFVFVNCFTVPLSRTVEELQRRVSVSINRALACDRSLTDYTFSSDHGRYSAYSPEQIERLVAATANALLEYMPHIEYCIDGLFDNFVSPLAFQVARDSGVKYYIARLWQYWDTRFHLVDGPGYVSSLVDDFYPRYYARLRPSMYSRVFTEFQRARFHPAPYANQGWRLRLRVVWDKMNSYERPSVRNFLRRRLSRIVGPVAAKTLRFVPATQRPERYILFALHVMPEAAILGTDPEWADQFSLIRRMSLNVPLGVRILCKAHPGDVFGRDLEIGFLRRLCTLHNVALVPESERIDSFIGDPRCLAIATINGSVAVESVLGGKPCFLFGQGLFAIANCFLKPRTDQQFFEHVMSIMAGRYSIDKGALAAIILSMKRATIPGTKSLQSPGTWLEFFQSLLPAIHQFHKRSRRRRRGS